MIKKTYDVKGMHCRSCEILIQDELKKIQKVKKVKASTKDKAVTVISDTEIDQALIAEKIEKLGYTFGKDDLPLVSKDFENYKTLLTAGILLFAFYLLAKTFGLNQLLTSSGGQSSNLTIVLGIGLTAGFSTCMALVGGLILGISARHAEKHPEATTFEKFRPHLFFNLGRILSYFLLGGLIGLVGSAFKLSSLGLGVITIFVGFIMLVLGLQLIQIFPRLSQGLTLPKFLSDLFKIKGRETREYSHRNAIILGALTFFLPCGFTQAMQVLAISSGSFVSGALIMGTFALGTTPGLLGIGGLTSYIKKGYLGNLFFKFIGLLVIALSIFNISNGLNLTGIKVNFTSNTINENDPNVKLVNGVQEVRMDQVATGYKPNKFTIKDGIPVKWIITSKDVNTCASSISLPKFKIQKILKLGENVIEFTPTEAGKINFSCAMGMYSGSFNVIENSSADSQQVQKVASASSESKPDVPAGPLRTDTQIIRATYTARDIVQPETINVKAGKPVRIEITAKDDGVGCMGSVMIPGIDRQPKFFEKGKMVVFEFTPDKPGQYQMTCAMGITAATINVN